MSDLISVGRKGHVAEVVFSHPPHNHATVALLRDLAGILTDLDEDPDCRAVVLASEGKAFCAGADLAAREGGGVGGATEDPIREFYDQALRLFASRKPIIAAIQGAAVGAGLGLALVADVRICSPEARFCANFTKLGFHPGFALTHTLPQLVGVQRAALMVLTARRFKPEEMLAWGLIDELVPAEALRASALRLAGEIAENAPLALLATRKTLHAERHAAAAAAMVREHAEQALLRETEDYAEGVRAVGERRPGRFIGR